LIIVGYVATLSWIIPAMSYNVYQMIEQHRIFAALKAIRYSASDDEIRRASGYLESFGLEGLIYVIQELNQEPERDRRIRLAKAIQRLLTGDEERLGWREKRELRKLLQRWDAETAEQASFSPAAEFDAKTIQRLMMKSPRDLSPEERDLLLRFGVEFWLVNKWRVEDDEDILAQRRQMLEFNNFLANKNIEFTTDERIRAGDILDDWLDEQQKALELTKGSAETQLLFRLQRFLCGDPVRFTADECKEMIHAVSEWHKRERKELSAEQLSTLKAKLQSCLKGASIPFGEEDLQQLTDRIMAFKDDYISYSLTVKFKKHLEDLANDRREEGRAEIKWEDYEFDYLKEIIRRREREYALARLEMAKAVADIVKSLAGKRFTMFVSDVPKTHSKLSQLVKIWYAKNDEIVVLDLVDLLKSDDFGVRVFMSDALVSIGSMSVRFLRKALETPRVSSVIVVATREKTKREREKELNAQNRRARIESAWILGRIGTPKAIAALKANLKDPDIGETVSDVLSTLVKQGGE